MTTELRLGGPRKEKAVINFKWALTHGATPSYCFLLHISHDSHKRDKMYEKELTFLLTYI